MRVSARAVLTLLAAAIVAGGLVQLALDDERRPVSLHEAQLAR